MDLHAVRRILGGQDSAALPGRDLGAIGSGHLATLSGLERLVRRIGGKVPGGAGQAATTGVVAIGHR
jgi:hypothetical protein